MRTAAIIPAFNESTRLTDVVLRACQYVENVVVVDDGSTIRLKEQLPSNEKLIIIRHPINLGKGAAMTTGVHVAEKLNVEAVVFLDGDGQHNPDEIPTLLRPLEEGDAEMTFGQRSFQKAMPVVAKFGNILLSRALQILFGIRVEDTQSGFRALRLSAYKKIQWESPRYAVETEMIVNAGKSKLVFKEVPISTIYYDTYKGTTVFDGVRIMLKMLTWKIL